MACLVAVQARAVYPDMFLQPQEQGMTNQMHVFQTVTIDRYYIFTTTHRGYV